MLPPRFSVTVRAAPMAPSILRVGVASSRAMISVSQAAMGR